MSGRGGRAGGYGIPCRVIAIVTVSRSCQGYCLLLVMSLSSCHCHNVTYRLVSALGVVIVIVMGIVVIVFFFSVGVGIGASGLFMDSVIERGEKEACFGHGRMPPPFSYWWRLRAKEVMPWVQPYWI